VVLDLGAGRGRGAVDDAVDYRRQLRVLRGKCQRVIGVDVDPAVRDNPGLDDAHVIGPNARLPLHDASVDLVVSDMTFEHIDQPQYIADELSRVLRPGGWICARTPNRWGYIGVGANLIPNRWHVALLKFLQPQRKAADVFPTTYKINTKHALRRYFPTDVYEHHTYGHAPEPAYFADVELAWSVVLLLDRITPEYMAPFWLIFLHKYRQ
jgi:SAM-dependent methyltransferase